MPAPHVFAGSPLDRVAARRRDVAWLEARLRDPASRFLALCNLKVLVKTSTPALAWATSDLLGRADPELGAVLLGVEADVAHFAVDVSALAHPLEELGVAGAAELADARMLAPRLGHAEAAIVAQARSLVDWHARHRFCAACGSRTAAGQGGYVRSCPHCKAEHFPRTDPVVIMIATRGDQCLLGRQKTWPKRMFSALAGFVEPGETLEEAVRRELFEESGVRTGAVGYHSSQPWPFPSSLMIGCFAEATSAEIVLDDELEEARWFKREVVRKALVEPGGTGELALPPPMAIAHQLARAWVEAGA